MVHIFEGFINLFQDDEDEYRYYTGTIAPDSQQQKSKQRLYTSTTTITKTKETKEIKKNISSLLKEDEEKANNYNAKLIETSYTMVDEYISTDIKLLKSYYMGPNKDKEQNDYQYQHLNHVH